MMIRKDKMFFLHYHLPASLFFAAGIILLHFTTARIADGCNEKIGNYSTGDED